MECSCKNCKFRYLAPTDMPCGACLPSSNKWEAQWLESIEAPIDCGPGKIEEPQKRAPSSFRITWFGADLTPLETKIQGVELILTDEFGNWVFYGEVVGDLRKLIFLVNAEHLVSIARLDAPVA